MPLPDDRRWPAGEARVDGPPPPGVVLLLPPEGRSFFGDLGVLSRLAPRPLAVSSILIETAVGWLFELPKNKSYCATENDQFRDCSPRGILDVGNADGLRWWASTSWHVA